MDISHTAFPTTKLLDAITSPDIFFESSLRYEYKKLWVSRFMFGTTFLFDVFQLFPTSLFVLMTYTKFHKFRIILTLS